MVRFQNLIKNVFLILHGHNIHCQQQVLSKFHMLYTQFAFLPYCGVAGVVFKMASQQEKALCVLRFEVSRSVITVQLEFRARPKKHISLVWCIFFKPCTKFTLHSNHRSGHLKWSTHKAFCWDAILETGPAAPQ
jgi:hypothetical protein